MTTGSLSDSRVTPDDPVFHDVLDRILEFSRENGKDHPVVMNTTVAILDALIALSDIEERTPNPEKIDARQRSSRQPRHDAGAHFKKPRLPSCRLTTGKDLMEAC
jgi:hypothetical protein